MEPTLLSNSLELFKLDMGIMHNLRDTYYTSILSSSYLELSKMGVDLSSSTVEDMKLIVDYAVWNYRKRQEDVGLSRNLKFRIHNRVIQKAGASDAKP